MNYDFTVLSPTEFELLVRDLLQKKLSIYLESFAEGRDGGIDSRFSRNKKNNIIIQCKRYKDYQSLKGKLNTEAKKVEKINPNRYLFVSTVDFTPANKKEISDFFKGYIKNYEDIIGKSDLNNLISQFPEIEKKYYKLWLSSTNVLNVILNNSIMNRSSFDKERILEEIKVFVVTKSSTKSIELLNKQNFIIISGIPGIGKTTLARFLINIYISKEYELISISEDIEEAERLFIKEKQQIFYFDDFLGSNFLEKSLNKNEDKRLLSFIRKIIKDDNKKLIMTTREYILNQAFLNLESFNNSSLDIYKYTIDLEKYSKEDKAKILYNHLYFSAIPKEYLYELQLNKRYTEIINHRNYNPRIIEYMIYNYSKFKPEEFYKYFIENLNNPEKVWEYAFTKHISDDGRLLLEILFIFNGEAIYDDLKTTYFNKNKNLGSYKNTLKELDNSFIKIQKINNIDYISFINPSLSDFIKLKLVEDEMVIEKLIDTSLYFEELLSVYTIDSVEQEKVILNQKLENILLEKFINDFDKLLFAHKKDFYSRKKNKIQYIKEILFLFRSREFNKLDVFLNQNLFPYLTIDIISGEEFWALCYLIENFSDKINVNKKILFGKIIKEIEDFEEMKIICYLYNKYPKIVNEIAKENIENYSLKEKITNIIFDIIEEDDIEYDYLIEIRDFLDENENELFDLIGENFNESCDLITKNIQEIEENIEEERQQEENQEEYWHYLEDKQRKKNIDTERIEEKVERRNNLIVLDIDDLFTNFE